MTAKEKRASVTVVIPTFNSARLVTEAIDSVLAQSLLPSQIIVVDDGSRDDTRDRLVPYMNRVRYVFQQNQGVSTSRNRGITEAETEWVAFLDADDVWHPRKLEFQMTELSKSPNLGFLGTALFTWPTSSFPDLTSCQTLIVETMRWEQFVLRTSLLPSSVIARTDLLKQLGGFDARLQSPEDRDLWMRIAEISQVGKLNLPLTGYRFVPGSLSQQIKGVKEGGQRILWKLDQRGAWKGRGLLRRKAYSFFHYQCSYEYNANGRLGAALFALSKSIAWYPLPFQANDVDGKFVRPKRLIVYLLRLLRLKPGDIRSPKELAPGPIK